MTDGQAAHGEWRHGGTLLLTAAMLNCLSSLANMAIGSLIEPLQTAFGWGRGEITLAFSFVGLGAMLITPFVGAWVARVGVRKVASIGLLAQATGLLAVGLSGPDLLSWYLAWTIIILANPLVSAVVWSTPIVRSFNRNRGLALAILTSATGAAAALGPLIAALCVANWSWRGAYFAFAAIDIAIALPIARAFFSDLPGIRTFVPDSLVHGGKMWRSLGHVVNRRHFWQIGLALVLAAITTSAIQLHFQPMLIDAGVSPMQAATMMSMVGGAMIIGRLTVGLLLDHFPGPLVGSIALSMLIVPVIIMPGYDGSLAMGLIAAGALGLSLGAEYDLLAYFASRYFDAGYYSVVFATLHGAFSLTFTVSPTIAGWLYDQLGSYSAFLSVSLGFTVLAVVLIATLGAYPASPHSQEHAQPHAFH